MEETAELGVNPNRVGIMMDVLDRIIADLNARQELKAIFGVPVSRSLVVVADCNDLRIEEAGSVSLTDDQQSKFLAVLDEVIRENSV